MTNKSLGNKIIRMFNDMTRYWDEGITCDGYTEIRNNMISVAFHDDNYEYEVVFYNYGHSIGATSICYGEMISRTTQYKSDKHVISVMLADLLTKKDQFITAKHETSNNSDDHTEETTATTKRHINPNNRNANADNRKFVYNRGTKDLDHGIESLHVAIIEQAIKDILAIPQRDNTARLVETALEAYDYLIEECNNLGVQRKELYPRLLKLGLKDPDVIKAINKYNHHYGIEVK